MRRTLLPVVSSLFLLACAPADDAETDFVEDPSSLPDDGKDDGSKQVGDYLARGCTTAAVLPLAQQVVDQMICIAPDQVSKLEPDARIKLVGAAILPYMDHKARLDLEEAAEELGKIEIESGMRTLPQQVLLYEWYQRGRCGGGLAARPGRSNHETGRALDVRNWREARRALGRHGWAQDVDGDEVHFDHLESPDGRGLDVVAFQRLWNLNHPTEQIDETGEYDDATAKAVRVSPARGFAKATCERPVDPKAPHPQLGDRFDPRRSTDWVRLR